MSIADFLSHYQLSRPFCDRYFYPMASAIWSSPNHAIAHFSAQSLLTFFNNHGLLSVHDQPQWHTVRGGSKVYVDKLCAHFRDRIRTNCAVTQVTRTDQGVEVTDHHGDCQTF